MQKMPWNQQNPQEELICNKEQYQMLKRCSDKKDMGEWNNWREENPRERIELAKAPLKDFRLEEANLQGARLWAANLQGAKLFTANLQAADLWGANLQDATLLEGNLQGASLLGTNLQHAKLMEADLRGARFWNAELQSADFSRVIVDGKTLFSEDCEVDHDTKFEAVALGNLRIYPSTKQLLEYNIRRKNWEAWYPKQNRWIGWLTRKFWEMSDYGISTQKVIKTFFWWAIVFAVIYYVLGAIDYYLIGVTDYPGPVANLFVDDNGPIYCLQVPVRSVYFSVVTMTTLGFGDMHANPHNLWWGWFGYSLLMAQVILGYVLLGALVTRFAVLFTAGGPAGKFSKTKPANVGGAPHTVQTKRVPTK